MSLLCLAVGIPVIFYLLLNMGAVRDSMRRMAETQLTSLLGAEVAIDKLAVEPFSRVILRDAVIMPSRGDTLLRFNELNAAVSLPSLLLDRQLVITDVELMQPEVRLWRDSVGAPLNAAPVIEALRGDGTQGSNIRLGLNTLVLRGGSVSYEVRDSGRRIAVSGLSADVNAPVISTDSTRLSIRRLQFKESGGVTLSKLRAEVGYAADMLDVKGLSIEMPHSHLMFDNMRLALREHRIGMVGLRQGSALAIADFGEHIPIDSSALPEKIEISGIAELFSDSVNVESLNVRVGDLLQISAHGNPGEIHVPYLRVKAHGDYLVSLLGRYARIPAEAQYALQSAGDLALSASASWIKTGTTNVNAELESDLGPLALNAVWTKGRLAGNAASAGFNLGSVMPRTGIGRVALTTDFSLGRESGQVSLQAPLVEYSGHGIENIQGLLAYRGKEYSVDLTVDDDEVTMAGVSAVDMTPGAMSAQLKMQVECFDIPEFKYGFSGNVDAAFAGSDLYSPNGSLLISGLKVTDLASGAVAEEQDIHLATDFESAEQSLSLRSGIADIDAKGRISAQTIGATIRSLAAASFPQLFPLGIPEAGMNDFNIEATIHDRSPLLSLLPLPMRPLYAASLSGRLTEVPDSTFLSVNAPFLQQGHKLVRDVELTVRGGAEGSLKASARMDNKKGPMRLDLTSDLRRGTASTSINWRIDNTRNYFGAISFGARPLPGGLDVSVRQSHMAFNDTIWTISPAYIGARGKSVIVSNLNLDGPGQHGHISGVVSPDSVDLLTVMLDNINLDYIFDVLALNAVHFGGYATGTVTGRSLLSGAPQLQTDNLFVRDFGYNHCTFGDAQIRARFDSETGGIILGADVENNKDYARARVDGVINPITQGLDIDFRAERLPVGFLQPFLATWAEEVGGRASGHARLFGDFINVDVVGDLKADDFSLKIGFTGVTYHATDSVHIRPGRIELNNIRVTDDYGHSARLDGQLVHDHFFESKFNFKVSEAKSLLVYDLGPQPETIFYGHVLGTGSVGIEGKTGSVSIGADMRTAPGSEFTVMVTDAADAADYNFLTFHDPTHMSQADSLAIALTSKVMDERKKEQLNRRALAEQKGVFDLNFRIDVTPQAQINLVMDPIAGDRIAAHGSGHVDFIYESGSDDMRMYGDYLIDRGDYNFTLQDIIIKNFAIRPGSVVSFHGDPMDAALNVKAQYQINANLTDLDESFATDKELQRTNVPVQAVLCLGGDLQNPDISFDLDFPTLTSDVKRKVRSIVSTDDMMNRQIIYLLALNRFYTPDYMEGATKGNGLASLASGTISSQLSNILGQISDKFSVAPSVRSDAGDFSDVEFDVALSSTLLNNRLLLNGNLGYRDKSLNNNQFIGDFDVEYLLNRAGSWRVKAYNHFNDRNLYIKTALTTQGLGIVFKHDFD